jgi:hypothetical protein
MVISSCSASGRGRVTLVMVSSSWSTSGRGRVTLVMVTVPPLLVTVVVLILLWKVVPAPLADQELLTITRETRPITSREGTAYHHKSNTNSVTSRVGTEIVLLC